MTSAVPRFRTVPSSPSITVIVPGKEPSSCAVEVGIVGMTIVAAREPDEYAKLAIAIVDNPMLDGETIRMDGAIRMAPR